MEVNSYAKYCGASYPIESDVLQTAPAYGDTNNTLNGTYDPGGGDIVPSANDVREGVPVAQTVGNLHVPPPEKVELGYLYDSNQSVSGLLECASAGSSVIGQDVFIVRGDDYAGDGAVRWDANPLWPDLTGASVKYGHAGGAFEKACSVDDGAIVLALTAEETGEMRGVYRYDVQATLSDGSVNTLVNGFTHVSPTHTDVPVNDELPPNWVG